MNHFSKLSSCKPKFAKFKILLYIYELIRFCKRNQNKSDLNNHFYNYSGRHVNEFKNWRNQIQTNIFEKKKCVFFQRISINMLPVELKNENSYSRFSYMSRLKLKNILLYNVAYNYLKLPGMLKV